MEEEDVSMSRLNVTIIILCNSNNNGGGIIIDTQTRRFVPRGGGGPFFNVSKPSLTDIPARAKDDACFKRTATHKDLFACFSRRYR